VRRSIRSTLFIVAILATVAAGAPCAAELPPRPETTQIPPRLEGAITGSEFARVTTGKSGPERQRLAIEELTRGNLPDRLRRLVSVRLTDQSGAEVVIWVMPDYLAIGSDADSLRIPLTYPSAVTVARKLGFVLPTRKMVDAIYEQAAVRLTPQPMPPGPRMRSSGYYQEHQRMIEEQLAGRDGQGLIAGHKKDIVLTNRLRAKGDRIAIYGWHRGEGAPIQPLSTVHGARYADYSHGLRLVWATAWAGGSPRPVLELLADPQWAPVLTYEGEIRRPGELMTWPPAP
jgi:hypothetical protein